MLTSQGLHYALIFICCGMGWFVSFMLFGANILPLSDTISSFISRRDWFSEQLVVGSLERYLLQGDADLGGFMLAFEDSIHIATVRLIDGPGVIREVYPYVSNFGLQYDLIKLIAHVFSLPAPEAWRVMVALNVCAMGLVVMLICCGIRREFSSIHALVVLALFCLSPLLLERTAATYWMLWMMFLPFAVSWWVYRPRWVPFWRG